MPMYPYKCKCGNEFDAFAHMKGVPKYSRCEKCDRLAIKQITAPNLKTDTSFFANGKYDMNVCDSHDDLIEGRKDWDKRLEKKHLRVLDWSEVKNPKMPKPKPVFAEE